MSRPSQCRLDMDAADAREQRHGAGLACCFRESLSGELLDHCATDETLRH
jgi:hypothetical protein